MKTINGIKLLRKGVKDLDGTYHPVQYSVGSRYEKAGANITTPKTYTAAVIYAKGYAPLPRGLFPQNDSDAMTDYFEKDRAVFREGTPEFDAIAAIVRCTCHLKSKVTGPVPHCCPEHDGDYSAFLAACNCD